MKKLEYYIFDQSNSGGKFEKNENGDYICKKDENGKIIKPKNLFSPKIFITCLW